MSLFETAAANPIIYGTASLIAGVMILIILRAAMTAEGGRSSLARAMTAPSAKYAFGLLFVIWAVGFGIGLQLVPHTGANSPYGGLALIALFTGFFIMMGFLWAVIGE